MTSLQYEAVERETVTVDYHGAQIHTIGGGTGGTSLAEALTMLNSLPRPATRPIAARESCT